MRTPAALSCNITRVARDGTCSLDDTVAVAVEEPLAAFDPASRTPTYKSVAVQVSKASDG